VPLLVELEPDVRALTELVPDLDVSLWPSFAHLAGAQTPAQTPPNTEKSAMRA
jgi:hypothetical protein